MTRPPDPFVDGRPQRRITGMAAALLPFDAEGTIDWEAFTALVGRIADAGLTPAVNMDTGYVSLLDPPTRTQVLEVAAGACPDIDGIRFVAGAFVDDSPGDPHDQDALHGATEEVASHGGMPIVFPSFGLSALSDDAWVAAHAAVGERCGRFLAFELGEAFLPQGRILPLSTYEELLDIDACIGAKHSSLRREPEWERLALRDEVRPEFLVLTGNDLAIDMVRWGSDYLLGLAAFAPDWFAVRDRCFEAGDPAFFEINDALQAVGAFAFRDPVPGYRHDAAMFLTLRGWIDGDRTHPGSPERPAADREVLAGLLARCEAAVGAAAF